MKEVGLIFGLWSIGSLIESVVRGVLADKFGWKVIIIFGLISIAVTSILMGFWQLRQLFVLDSFMIK